MLHLTDQCRPVKYFTPVQFRRAATKTQINRSEKEMQILILLRSSFLLITEPPPHIADNFSTSLYQFLQQPLSPLQFSPQYKGTV